MTQELITGYHGTSRTAALSILKNGFRKSTGDKQWLGDGVYFFAHHAPYINGKNEALSWATKVRHCEYPEVIEASFKLDNETDLNFCFNKYLRQDFEAKVREQAPIHLKELNKRVKVSTFLKNYIKLLIDNSDEINLVMANTNGFRFKTEQNEKETIIQDIIVRHQIQVCVISNKLIKSLNCIKL